MGSTANTPMPSASFSHLPCELREMVWAVSVRDTQRAAHFFTVSAQPRLTANGLGFELAAPMPQDDPVSVEDRIVGNPSAYMQDASLWTACASSRTFMSRQYRRLWQAMNPRPHTDPFVTCGFTRDGEEWRFKVLPSQDLFCIQPLNTGASWHVYSRYMLPGRGDRVRLTNVALKFDPAWLDSSVVKDEVPHAADGPLGFIIRTLQAVAEGAMGAGFQFWLIDRTIRKREQPLPSSPPPEDSDEEDAKRSEPAVFHGRDKRYVHIRDESECTWDASKPTTAFRFLDWLQIEVGLNTRWMMAHRTEAQRTKPPLPYRDLDELVMVLAEEDL
ncbi:hypothetical protein BBK36DRAFT_1121112 [Trichoderma citrinoviride]|uniref:Uncharacterized protein n=1 Tax=Trichoderma citrinoviride TaxID=58853 RepID=A0A2T4B8B1_9HYPO|nr:hypothetical protein BBK36DRAFT_1121112 [Trichoderma citrinoviride]PTB65565.1 hypothetical protein BBK36DRAFT_1121112 [Trichoderma citrinoviride]